MTSAEMPVHTHTQNAHGHVVSSNSFAGDLQIVVGPRGGDGAFYSFTDSGNDAGVSAAVVYARDTTATNQNTGGGNAHTNTQPTLVLNYIIKATQ
jgi:microcystin-dependent protein